MLKSVIHVENYVESMLTSMLKISACVDIKWHVENCNMCWKLCWKHVEKAYCKFQCVLKSVMHVENYVESMLKISVCVEIWNACWKYVKKFNMCWNPCQKCLCQPCWEPSTNTATYKIQFNSIFYLKFTQFSDLVDISSYEKLEIMSGNNPEYSRNSFLSTRHSGKFKSSMQRCHSRIWCVLNLYIYSYGAFENKWQISFSISILLKLYIYVYIKGSK